MSIDRNQASFMTTNVASVTWGEFPGTKPLRRFALNGATMGTRYAAIFFAPENLDTAAAQAALQRAVDLVDNQMSTWKPYSDLSRFNDAATEKWVDVPRELALVAAEAVDIGRASSGAFDINVGDLVDAWGFGPLAAKPDAERVPGLAARSKSGAADALDVDLSTCRLRKRAPMKLDLCGIAKGYGVDQMADSLDRLGVESYLVSIDGEMRAKGHKPGGESWIVAVEQPDREAREIARRFEIADLAIATSGDYRHWTEYNGISVSHTMDPVTGRPLDNNLASVTVLADTCMRADAWATALMVLGEIEGPKLADRLGLDALFIIRGANGLRETGVGRLAG